MKQGKPIKMHKIISALIFLLTIKAYYCQDLKNIFEKINQQTEKINALAAEITWESSTNPRNPNLYYKSDVFQKENIEWNHRICEELERMQKRISFNRTQLRQKYLLCRGPIYSYKEARIVNKLYEELQSIYTEAEVCIPTVENVSSENVTETETNILKYLIAVDNFVKELDHEIDSTMFAVKNVIRDDKNHANVLCLKGENDFSNIMTISRNEKVLKWVWLVWREKVGPPMKEPYRKLVEIENIAAERNGYTDIGASWREELEIPNLRQTCRRLYEDVKPLYTMLHGVVRYYLRKEYGELVPETGPIPAHLLGGLWSQNWESLADLIFPNKIDFDESIRHLNWTVNRMVKRAEDFYQSLGLPPMTDLFWKKSVFLKENNETQTCHGSAANMFKSSDFRLLYCSGKTKEDFYVFHHELGHIHYYMAYEHQPALFRQANMAFHEAIGDTIMYGVMTPQHLHRLGLINDSLLYSTVNHIGDNQYDAVQYNIKDDNEISTKSTEYLKNNDEGVRRKKNNEDVITTDDILLLKQALNKIPLIPFSLLIDEYRWQYFKGDFSNLDMNKRFWEMALELQGLSPPMERAPYEFDIGAKFHVPDNTPFIRYFLGSFLQNQLFESLCKAAVFGRRGEKEPLPETIALHRCDIYGSKAAGLLLKDIMSRGHSQHWQQILKETTGQDHFSAEPLLRYYRPLYLVLKKHVRLYDIPIGW